MLNNDKSAVWTNLNARNRPQKTPKFENWKRSAVNGHMFNKVHFSDFHIFQYNNESLLNFKVKRSVDSWHVLSFRLCFCSFLCLSPAVYHLLLLFPPLSYSICCAKPRPPFVPRSRLLAKSTTSTAKTDGKFIGIINCW